MGGCGGPVVEGSGPGGQPMSKWTSRSVAGPGARPAAAASLPLLGAVLLVGCAVLCVSVWRDVATQAATAPGGEEVIVARSGSLEEIWEAPFHVAWPLDGQARAWLTAVLPVARSQRLQPGDEIKLRLDAGEGEQELLAKVNEISASVDGVAHVVFTTAETYSLASLPEWVPGRIVVRAGPYGTIVPVSALHQRANGAGEGVYVARRGGAVWVPVRVVARSLTEAVVEGIAPGTRLAVRSGS